MKIIHFTVLILTEVNKLFLTFISTTLLESGIKHRNILHLAHFKASGIRAGFMNMSCKNGTRVVQPLLLF